MELWIRSQDKEKLVLTKGFETQHTNYDGGCQIFAVWENNYQMVGKYKTKKRALEVLDEIQNKIKPEYMLRNINRPDEPPQYEAYYEEKPTIIYEMPQE